MAVFAYIARDQRGSRVSGRVEATNEQAAAADLSARGLAPVRLQVASKAPPRAGRVSARRLATSYRQLADLLRSGVPLLRGLQILGRGRSDPKLAATWSQVADAVADGARLGDAMAQYERVFPAVQVAVIRAGERGAFLEPALTRLSGYLERQSEMRSRIVGALIYPSLLVVIGVVILVGALTFMVPMVREQFARIDLPIATRVLFFTSDVLTWGWPIIVPVLAALGVGFVIAWRRERPRRAMAAWILRVPKLGSLVRGIAAARVTRVLGTLLENGIPLLQAMQTARDAAGHPRLADAMDRAIEAVRGGEPLAKPLGESGFLEEDVVEMISVGESANNLPEVLVSIAAALEARVDRALAITVQLLEPVLIVVIALGVFSIFMALVLPMMKMSSAL